MGETGRFIGGFALMDRLSGKERSYGSAEWADASVDLSEFAHVLAVAAYLPSCNFDDDFEVGLDLMIEGLRVKVQRGL